MSDSPFPILGTDIPPMLGREKVMERMWTNLTKPTPSHLSVVGPRFSGKSVLLNGLSERMRNEATPYTAVVFWDLGHNTPRSDEEFIKMLCRSLAEGLKEAGNEYGDHLLNVTTDEYAEICEVMDVLDTDKCKVLMLWDGFDKPLSTGGLTRNLWDNLLELCRKPSFRLVTSTRKELHKLIRDEKSVTSDFWGIFEGVVRIGRFDAQDADAIISGLDTHVFQTGARSELENWSALLPPLFLEVLNHVVASTPSGQIDNMKINQAASSAATGEKLSSILSSLWADCTERTKELYRLLVERGELISSETGRDERKLLLENGFAHETGNKIKPACRMLQEHVSGGGPDAGSLARLFGTWDNYRANIRALLELRLEHIPRFDDRLFHLVSQVIGDIPDYPDYCLAHLPNIRDRSLTLIWQHETDTGGVIPQDAVSHWTTHPRNNHKLVNEMMSHDRWSIPDDPLAQIRLIQLLTGSWHKFEAKARKVSKSTYVLLDAIHNFRNRALHSDGQAMHLGVAVAAIMTCLELLACLERELRS